MRRDKQRRWALVVAVAAVLIALPAVVAAVPASVDPVEPGRLRELIMRSAGVPYQGYAETAGSLGLPDLPNLEQVTSLLSGTTRIRSWYDSPTRWRFDVLSPIAGERDIYRTPDGEYIWDYGANLLTQVVGEQPMRLPRAGDLLPPDLARWVLGAAPGDRVEALPPRWVAGVAAAGLRLRPADPDTALGQIDIWADPATGLPVRVEVFARDAGQPFLVSRFVELSRDRPGAGSLTPPLPRDSGYAVTTVPDITEALATRFPTFFPERLAGRPPRVDVLAGVPNVGLYGTGLSAFVVLPLPSRLAGSAMDAASKAGAAEVTLPGGTGRLLTVAPVSVIIQRSTVSRRSYLLAGLIDPAVLVKAAGELSTAPRSGP